MWVTGHGLCASVRQESQFDGCKKKRTYGQPTGKHLVQGDGLGISAAIVMQSSHGVACAKPERHGVRAAQPSKEHNEHIRHKEVNWQRVRDAVRSRAAAKKIVTTVGFEPTPFLTSALNWRLRPLGQVASHAIVPAISFYRSLLTRQNSGARSRPSSHLCARIAVTSAVLCVCVCKLWAFQLRRVDRV